MDSTSSVLLGWIFEPGFLGFFNFSTLLSFGWEGKNPLVALSKWCRSRCNSTKPTVREPGGGCCGRKPSYLSSSLLKTKTLSLANKPDKGKSPSSLRKNRSNVRATGATCQKRWSEFFQSFNVWILFSPSARVVGGPKSWALFVLGIHRVSTRK